MVLEYRRLGVWRKQLSGILVCLSESSSLFVWVMTSLPRFAIRAVILHRSPVVKGKKISFCKNLNRFVSYIAWFLLKGDWIKLAIFRKRNRSLSCNLANYFKPILRSIYTVDFWYICSWFSWWVLSHLPCKERVLSLTISVNTQ